MRRAFCVPALTALLLLACSQADDAEPNGPTDTSAGRLGGASGATGNAGSGAMPSAPTEAELPHSGLPLIGAEGATKPAGAAGNLKVLNWAGFKAAVTYTFDDANRSQIKHYAELQALGVPMSFYLITGKPEASDPVWAQAVADGHEVANHTQSHLQMGDTLAADTDAGAAFIKAQLGVEVYTMAAPYGAAAYSDIARTRYLINRGVNDQQIAPNGATDPFNLSCYIPAAATLASTFNAKVDAVRAAGNWQTLLVHGFTDMDATEGAYQPVDFGEFAAGVTYAKTLGDVWIDSLVNIGAYWLGQKALSAVTPAVSGGETTWSWTLPAHFPPGKYLRVTVDGGTLEQGGSALPWDPHGYYEVALDAGSLTLSP
jgi:peptidoglycan/xylan/chitin deacetylase (PgdA/CDA1 family)